MLQEDVRRTVRAGGLEATGGPEYGAELRPFLRPEMDGGGMPTE